MRCRRSVNLAVRRQRRTGMTMSVLPRLTIMVCLLAAVVETFLACTSTAGLSPGDVFPILFFVGPYVLLVLFARWQRSHMAASWMLLVVTVALSVWGLYTFGEDSYRYHTELEYRMVQRMSVFIVAIGQWAVVLLVGFGLLLWRLISRRSPGTRGTKSSAAPDRSRE